jgi:hypothetical protein
MTPARKPRYVVQALSLRPLPEHRLQGGG